ncbi:YedE-related selenium metabolism membrane protein [Desulfovibrio sp. OttesenSCG-928-C06]|nr:YedE-related selenium metabolism membrane protein [Desulfovibrio sp. OttesenSCG-928-C06]
MRNSKNLFATTGGVVVVGLAIGLLASLLQHLGNPANMGICVACFERDIAGAIGLHRAAIVQYIRPEIIGLVLGSLVAAMLSGDFKARGGSAPIQRFLLGMLAIIGALVFLGCPWRALLRLAGGDWNAIVGLFGLAAGIFIGTLFLRNGYSLGSSNRQPSFSGYVFPLLMVGLLILMLIFPQVPGEDKSGILFYSLKGPGSMHAPLLASLGIGLVIGFIAQRSRFCTMGALRDLFLFRQTHLLLGVIALVVAAFAANLALGQFNPGFTGQPVAHDDALWNFSGMLMAGLAFALAGGCPGRQLFMSGEGDSDAAIFALGMIAGAAVSHNFGLASSGAGAGPNGPIAVGIGMVILLIIGFANRKKA